LSSVRNAIGLRAISPLALYAPTIFLSAWLLFQVQPMFAKMALPLLGGTSSVWNTALVFFQAALLLGYLYAHLITSRLTLRWQVGVHLAVLALAVVALPVAIGEGWRDPPETMPIPWLIALLTVSVGLPFFAVSANSPLLQGWFARTGHATARDPYFLYAASNLGSMLALLAYPFVIEPSLRLDGQSWLWTGAYAVLVALIGACALYVLRRKPAAAPADEAESAPAPTVRWADRFRWLALAFVPSGLLVAATNFMTTDLAAIPLLWIVPLALYLLSFVLVFARKPLLAGPWTARVQAVLLCIAAVFATWSVPGATYYTLALVLATLFATSLVCHGELVRRRPAASRLTEFYVWMSLGGILGSAFCALLAPLIFDSVLEYAILIVVAGFLRPSFVHSVRDAVAPAFGGGLAAATLREASIPGIAALAVAGLAFQGDGSGTLELAVTFVVALFVVIVALGSVFRPVRFGMCLAVLVGLGVTLANAGSQTSLHRERTFFATHQVLSVDDGRFVALSHGSTIHGAQAIDPARRRETIGYFHGQAGIGRMFGALQAAGRKMDEVGVLGLGAGTLACYAQPGQNWTFFEIDPAVIRIAKDPRFFHFLSDCTPKARLLVGDGRLLIARESAGRYDLIISDVFSSDSIPVHLYTREAIRTYFEKLKPDGLLLMNVTNRYINFEPALAALTRESGLSARIMRSYPTADAPAMHFRSFWVAMARTEAVLAPLTDGFDAARPTAWGRWRALAERPGVRSWTDDYSNLIELIE